jgi:chemotaxis protein methyltransferase CheR
VAPHIRDSISWRRVNLADSSSVAPLGEFDFIICRNVLIYFRDPIVESVVETLTKHLVSGGRLLVGTSESLLRFNCSLACEEQAGVFFYRDKR